MTRPHRTAEVPVADLSGVQCIGYVRVSTDRQAADDRTSMADQERAITEAASRRGLKVGAWFRDAGASGATVEKRPQLRALLASCERHSRPAAQPGLVIALNDSRWGRFPNPEEAGYWRFHLSKLGWTVRFAEGDDVDDVMGRGVMRFIGAAQASEYRLALQRNTRRGMKGTAESGYWSRPEPFGYRRKVVVGRERILQPGERKADGERVALVPDAREAAVVRKLFESYASGEQSVRSLCRWARTNAPLRIWSVRAVGLILGNPTYCGDIQSRHRCSDSYGKADAHPAIVSRELFARVQARLKMNKATPRSPKSPWLLSGLVACSHCNEPYTAGGLGGRPTEKRIPFYADRGGRADMKGGKRCEGTMGTVARHLLDDAVISTIADVLGKPATQRRIEAAVDRYFSSAGDSTATEHAEAKRELARLEKRRDNLVSLVADGTLERHEAATQLATVRAQIEQAKEAVQRSAFARRQVGAGKSERAALLAMASSFAESVKILPPQQVRELIRPWLAKATFDKRTRELTLGIRRVPAVAGLILGHSPGQGTQDQDLIVRRLKVGAR